MDEAVYHQALLFLYFGYLFDHLCLEINRLLEIY